MTDLIYNNHSDEHSPTISISVGYVTDDCKIICAPCGDALSILKCALEGIYHTTIGTLPLNDEREGTTRELFTPARSSGPRNINREHDSLIPL